MAEGESRLTELWNEAVDEYLSKMNRKFDVEKLRAQASCSDDLEALIEDHKSKFSKFRTTHGKLISVFYSTMKRLRSPARLLKQVVQNVTDRLDEYFKGSIDKKLRRVIVSLLCSLLDVFYETEGAIRRVRGREMMRRVTGRENKVQSALDILDQMLQTELGLIIAKTYATIQRIDKKTDISRDQALLDQALSTNVALDMERLYIEIEESRLPQSGEWLLKQQLFRRESMQTQYTPSIVLTSIASQIAKTYDAYSKRATAICKDGSSLLSPT
ncbi:hypothetical protein F5Y13DRAFT_197858 [Hypoxylon sp. FL1857]|nr:hypothetical protein F5Y13DRAFT_197858 [Hypoxylon sp. FL1857]